MKLLKGKVIKNSRKMKEKMWNKWNKMTERNKIKKNNKWVDLSIIEIILGKIPRTLRKWNWFCTIERIVSHRNKCSLTINTNWDDVPS